MIDIILVKMYKRKRNFSLWLIGLLSAMTLLLGSAAAYASISYAYQSKSSLINGDIVSLAAKSSGFVTPSNTSNGSNLLGIVTSASSSTLAVDPSSSTVQVVTSGSVPVLVSTINGSINAGDQISISPLSGIGMKAESDLPMIGIAQGGFNSHSQNATTRQIVNNKGQRQTVSVGYVLLTIKIGSASNSQQVKLNGLQNFIKNLTGRTVSTIRIVISLVVSLVAIIILGVLVYSSIFGSIISIGRNPLAKASIKRTLMGVIAMASILAVVTVIVVNILLS